MSLRDLARVEHHAHIDLDLGHEVPGTPDIRWFSVASQSRAQLNVKVDLATELRTAVMVFDVNGGGIADAAAIELPLHELTEFVHAAREADLGLDGFTDALDGRPPRGFSTNYLDQYALGEVEARERAS